ncbi:MAG: 16S rRNA (guanine(966)-N(2))-methyltransferase RsmD [Alphaproteobacteria bacterium]|nr:16S rRNA (guanine(966)-N(2))-methyltransferase RsmD [Alphaproteobacteria bacterium]
MIARGGTGSVRIGAGVHRGRKIAVPPGASVRPTSDRVRAALFNILAHRDWDGIGPLPRGVAVLDAFAGSGALGIEALSRGATEVLFLERDAAIRKNLERTLATIDEVQRAYVLPRDATRPGSLPGSKRFGLMLADAPYGTGLAATALGEFAREGWLAPHAVAAVELDAREEFAPPAGFALIEERAYGNTRLVFLQKSAAVKQL